jgi:hypothetical protein
MRHSGSAAGDNCAVLNAENRQLMPLDMDPDGLNGPFARGPLGGRRTGRAHRVTGLVRVLQRSGLGNIPARGGQVSRGMDGAHREVRRLMEREVEIVRFLQGCGRRQAHFVVNGRMLCPVGTRTGDVAQVGKDALIHVDGMAQFERYLGSGCQALRPEEQVQEGREIGLGEAPAHVNGDVAGVQINVDNDAELVV